MATKKQVYWDSCTFIDRIQRSAEWIGVLEKISNAAEKGEVIIATSAFTLCEVAKVKKPDGTLDGTPEEQERKIMDFFNNPFIAVRSLDRFVAVKAREIMRYRDGIKGKDAVHIATAISNHVPLMHTTDKQLVNLTGAPCLGTLKIETPSWDEQVSPVIYHTGDLFAQPQHEID